MTLRTKSYLFLGYFHRVFICCCCVCECYTRNFIPSLNYLWEADTVVMTSYAKENENYRYFLLVVNAGSKYVWTINIPCFKNWRLKMTLRTKSYLFLGYFHRVFICCCCVCVFYLSLFCVLFSMLSLSLYCSF
jgi:hypothetical protein